MGRAFLFRLATCLGLAIAGIAFAQESAPLPTLQWQGGLPTTGREYPTQALERGIAGNATLCCTLATDLHVACRVTDSPPYHFGDAALVISRRLLLTPESAEALRQSGRGVELYYTFDGGRGSIRIGRWVIVQTGSCPLAAE